MTKCAVCGGFIPEHDYSVHRAWFTPAAPTSKQVEKAAALVRRIWAHYQRSQDNDTAFDDAIYDVLEAQKDSAKL